MKDAANEIIYVGKAVNLRNRVRSYFQSSKNGSPKVKALVEHIADFEYIVTDSEVEALILESNLIKKHSPWYNVRLKDDKSYPYIKVTLNEYFPRVFMVRRKVQDGSRYFGPYTNAKAVKETLLFLHKLFPLRTCKKDIRPGQQDRPCLNYHIGKCLAPCAGKVGVEEYRKMVDEVCLFLEGRHERIIPDLEKRMGDAAADLQFEKAARYRDQIQSLNSIIEKQKVVSNRDEDYDVLGFHKEEGLACVQVFFVRSGKVIGRHHFLLDCAVDEEEPEILAAFIKQYYSEASFIPKDILLPFGLDDRDVLEEWLTQIGQRRISLKIPQRGEKRRLVEMVNQNAELVLGEYSAYQERKKNERALALSELKDVLRLENEPTRIEAYDISNTQGNQIVAAMVVMIDGRPMNQFYRRFKITSVTDGPDDYRSMQEVIRRRFSNESLGDFPDLVVIDGGKGQLNAAVKERDQLGLNSIPFIGLAEKNEEVFVEGDPNPVGFKENSPGHLLLQHIRDEAHRFALSYHRNLRQKASRQSALDSIDGVGPKRKRALLRHFGTVQKIREATIEQLMEVEGMNKKVAQEVYQHLRTKK